MPDSQAPLIEYGLQRNRPAPFLPGVKQKALLNGVVLLSCYVIGIDGLLKIFKKGKSTVYLV